MSLQDSKEVREAIEFEQNVTKSVFVMCGNPFGGCCMGKSVRCEFDFQNIPDELKFVMPIEEYLSMISEIDEVLQATLVPAFPCMLGHFCLPFAPICYYKEQRHKRIQAILDKYNILLFDRGYHWEAAPTSSVVMGFAFLMANKATNRGAVVKNAQLDGNSVVSGALVACEDIATDGEGDYEMVSAALSPIEHEV